MAKAFMRKGIPEVINTNLSTLDQICKLNLNLQALLIKYNGFD